MLTPEELLKADTPPRFEIAVDKLRIRDRDVGAARIPVSYDADWTPVFHLGEFAQWEDAFTDDRDVDFSFEFGGRLAELFLSSYTNDPNTDERIVEANATQTPLQLGQATSSTGFSAVLLSPPALRRPLLLQQDDKVFFEILPTNTIGTIGAAPCLLRSNLSGNAEEVWLALRGLHSFLTFVKGRWCGLGHLVAEGERREVAFLLLGFGLKDRPGEQDNWFDFPLQNDLPQIFGAFCAVWSDEMTKRALLQGIEYYRASNVLRSASPQMAIIAAHTALEALVHYILEHRAGWSKSMMAEKGIKFSDKMRAAATFLRVDGDLLEQSPELRALSKSRNDTDAFDLLSFVRNKLVHQDPKYSPRGLELHEAWLLAQWLVEVLIFGIIGYRGTIRDRRLYKGWGGMMKLPFRS